ncbi:hypothetical protein WG66_008750 [Moniliophthora roreri]|nr:hypothetical protein WG66_008750 [Moniliophthora roreri]
MIVDENQSAGVLIGLRNQLVLRAKGDTTPREVLIPRGKVNCSRAEPNHTHVTINTGSDDRVYYYRYKIDETLGRLVGNMGLHGQLYKAYLHAVTAYCLPDPLTGRTGTEEALHELQSATCRSFQTLGRDSQALLRHLDSLSPSRVYYPPHLAVMQTVQWTCLPPTAQHDGFTGACRAIVDLASRLQVFYPENTSIELHERQQSEHHLLDRAASRNSLNYPNEFQCIHGVADKSHWSRDLVNDHTQGESLVFKDASFIVSWPTRLPTTPGLWNVFKEWSTLCGPRSVLTTSSLSYNREWMDEPLPKNWLTLYDLSRGMVSSRYQVLFTFCAMGYGTQGDVCRPLLPTLLAFATTNLFIGNDMKPPEVKEYKLSVGREPDKWQLLRVARNACLPFDGSYARDMVQGHYESGYQYDSRRRSRYSEVLEREAQRVVDTVIWQWPCERPSAPSSHTYSLVLVENFVYEAKSLFLQWYHNHLLSLFVDKIQARLDSVQLPEVITNASNVYHFRPLSVTTQSHVSVEITLKQLFDRDPPIFTSSPPDLHVTHSRIPNHPKHAVHQLRSLFELDDDTEEIKKSCGARPRSGASIRTRYADTLRESLQAFLCEEPSIWMRQGDVSDSILKGYEDDCYEHFQETLAAIKCSLEPGTDGAQRTLSQSGLWPRITVKSLLQSIASVNGGRQLCHTWIDVLQQLARSVLLFQRSRRLRRLRLSQRHEDFWKEMDTPASVMQSVNGSDWLLIQADNDFLVRPVQLAVAKEMISPADEQNTVLQLNMGEGKSSVIVPLVATTLADGKRLARIIVLKPLASQMFSLLVERLSRLTNRQILYLPFSRDVKIGRNQVENIREIYEQAMQSQAILVAQPEHILSYQLMSVERLLNADQDSEKNQISRRLLDSQLWLDANTRDVLDESDEILHVRYQLIYTMGNQQSLENSPDRWTTVQQLLSVIQKCSLEVHGIFPLSIEITGGDTSGSFPHIRLLQAEAGEDLVNRVTDQVINSGALDNCSFTLFSSDARKRAREFILNHPLSNADIQRLKKDCHDSLWANLLLLRGLLGHGILVYVLRERRWRVDFGLDPSRTLLAVPYRAKDVPSLRAEFGHPDVATLLTCLSYYYGGLTRRQLGICFELLYKLDNPRLEYDKWIDAAGNDILPSLRDLSAVNMQDSEQREKQLFPSFRLNHGTIDFYLAQVVFPKASKEFPEKLTTSGWDLARNKAHLTTGFSGTNDSQFILPTSIHQHNSEDRLSTNAKVLAYLLQPENNHYLCPVPYGQCLSGRGIIKAILEHGLKLGAPLRVLLDVGAQILEMSNIQVVDQWLKQSHPEDVAAAIFFDNCDQLQVLTRDGLTEPFALSPYSQHIDKCIVYLDDVHTRGTDLKLPINWRACVTLGPKVTKDRLVQSCMRMRKLGYGQSVSFMAPPEIDHAIRKQAQKEGGPITSLDILRWAINKTCAEIEHHVPHWVQQGVDFMARNKAWKSLSSSSPSEILHPPWVQKEAQELQEMYLDTHSNVNSLNERAHSIPDIWKRCEFLGVMAVLNPQVEEEQEREVSHEVEEEPQKQRPPKAAPANHHVHEHVKTFIASECIPPHSQVFFSIFTPLQDGAGALQQFQDCMSPSCQIGPLATSDFLTTIKTTSIGNGDYIRPVNWLVSGKDGVLVVLSPYEINQLLSSIRKSKNVILHIYTPRTTQFMKSIDNLRFYCIPSLPPSWRPPSESIIDLLNLASGQLYFSDYTAYLRVCALLGICTLKDQKEADIRVQSDGFIRPENHIGHVKEACLFDESPLPYLKVLTGFRRKGQITHCLSTTV